MPSGGQERILNCSCNRLASIFILAILFTPLSLNYFTERGGCLLAAGKKAAEKKPVPFWQSKRIEEWSPQEVQLFLQDSPWAKTQRITVSIKSAADPTASQPPPVVAAAQTMKIESCCRTFEVPVTGSNVSSTADSQGSNSPASSKELSRVWNFSARVLWFSSVSMRRAVIRQRQLQGVPVQQAEAALAPSSDIVLALSGSFLKLLEGMSSNEVQTISLLRTARGAKQKLLPAEYIPANADADPMAFLIFPKTLQGKPIFSLGDGPVMFSLKGIDFELECQFLLEPMVVDGNLDW